jgi:hypothetical protein
MCVPKCEYKISQISDRAADLARFQMATFRKNLPRQSEGPEKGHSHMLPQGKVTIYARVRMHIHI